MFREITQSDLREKKRLVTQESTSLYVSLKNTLAKDELHTLFAEPLPTPNQKKMAWFTNLEGEILPLQALTAEEQARARAELNKQTQAIKNAIAEHQNPELTKLIESLLVVPNENAIFLVRDGDNWHMVLTEWGYIMDVPETETDILYKYLDMPVYTFAFMVQYENGEILPDVVFEVITKGKNAQTFTTDSAGKFNFSLFEGEEVSIKEAQNRYSKEFTAYKNRDELIILSLPAQDMRFEVQDAQNSPTPQSTWIFEYQGQTIEHTSDFQGRIVLPQVPFGVVVKAFQREAGKEINLHTHTCRQEESKYILRLPAQIKPAEPTNMLFRVLKGKKPVEDAKLTLAYLPASADSRRAENLPTNAQGEYAWENVPIGAKVKATASKKFKRRTRTVTKTFTHTEKQEAYILRYRNYWWLLWFLLLLIPFIPLPISMDFTVLDAYQNKPIQKPLPARVTLEITPKDKDRYTQKTDSKGMAHFERRWIFLFELVFPLDKLSATAHCDCFEKRAGKGSTWTLPRLYKLPLETKDRKMRVVGGDDKQPLPDAEVQVEATWGELYKQKMMLKTDLEGVFVLRGIPMCAKVRVLASKNGYQDREGTDTLRKWANDSLKLTPKKGKVSFWVRNKADNQPLPDAEVSLFDAQNKLVQKGRTNINGMIGLVEFGVRIVDSGKSVRVLGRKQGFYDDSLRNTIGYFLQADSSKRVLYLKPKTMSISFKVIDKHTGLPLPNAEATINCGGKIFKAISNANGVAIFAEIPDDCLPDVVARKEGYFDNGVKAPLKDLLADDNKRVIPLTPNVPCVGGDKKGSAYSIAEYQVGSQARNLSITFDMYGEADEIVVYCGTLANKGKILYRSGKVSSKHTHTIAYNCQMPPYSVVVEILADAGSAWEYAVQCQ